MATSTKKRKSYHTNFKIAAQLDFLPEAMQRQIPKSTLHRFKISDYSNLFGSEYSSLMEDQITLLKQFAKDKKAQQVYRAYILLQSVMLKMFVKIPKNLPLVSKEKIVRVIERFKESIGFKKALKIFRITQYTFRLWKDQVKYQCVD